MIVPVSVPVRIGPVVGQYRPAPAFLAVVGVAVLVTLVMYVERPRVSRRAVAALVPWMVAGAALSILAASASYPAVVRPAVSGMGAYLTIYVIVCVAWFASLQFSRGGLYTPRLPTYLAAMGSGVAAVVVGALLFRAGDLDGSQLFWLAIAPIASAAIAGIVLLLLGLWYPEAAAYTGMAGGMVVFGHAFAAIGTAVAVVADGAHTTLSWTVLTVLETAGVDQMVGLDLALIWVWGYVWTKLVLAITVIIVLTAYTHRHPDRGNLFLGLVAAVGVISGATALLSSVVMP